MRKRSRSLGVAAIEFAIVLPLLLGVSFVIAELARAMYEYDSLVKNARAAARYLTTTDPSNAENRDRAVCIAKAADPYATCMGANPPTNPTPAPWLARLSGATVTVQWSGNAPGLSNVSTGHGTVDLITVIISGYVYDSFLLPNFYPSSDANSTFRVTTFGPIAATMTRLGV